MYYTVYKIINNIDGKIYIGIHKTKDIDDGYMGSGKYLKNAQEKYGIENFEKEILKVFNTSEEMFNMESILVNEEFVQSKETYNLKLGGFGGFDYLNSIPRTKEHNIKISESRKGYKLSKKECESRKGRWIGKNNPSYKKDYKGDKNPFSNKKHSEESKRKIGELNSKHQTGEGNSQFGTMWIYNLEEKLSKKIKK